MKRPNFGRRSPFVVGVLTLMTGTAIAQAIPIAFSPLLTRIYSPSDMGLLSLFLVVTATLGAVASGRYELAIMLPEDEDDAFAVAVLGMTISFIVSLVAVVVILLFSADIAQLLGSSRIQHWLYLAPLAIFSLSTFNCLNYLTTRQKRFSAVARASVARAITGVSIQCGLGLAVAGPAGLLTGYTVSAASANVSLFRLARGPSRLRHVTVRQLLKLAKRFQDFPKYSVGSALAQTALLSSLSVLLARYFTVEDLGQFALVQRVLGVPLLLLGGSIGQVFFQRASEYKRATGSMRVVFLSTLRWLVLVSVVTTVLLYAVLPTAFEVAFGDTWRSAGAMARNLLPGFAAQFVVSPLSLSNQVNMRNRLGLVGNVTALVVVVSTFIGAAESGASVGDTLLFMSLAQACYYMGFLYLIYRHVDSDRLRSAE